MSISKVVHNLFLKKVLLEGNNPAHRNIRTALLVLGGGMQGANGGGTIIALHLLGLGNVFDTVIGISTGAGIGAYFLGGLEQSRSGTSLYYEDAPPRFIKYARRPIVDIDFIEQCLREGKKRLDIPTILASRPLFFVGVTNAASGAPALLNAKEAAPDLISAVKASMAIPGWYGKTVTVNGIPYVDGSAFPLPIETLRRRFDPTDILIIANCTRDEGLRRSPRFLEQIINAFMLRKTPLPIRRMVQSRHRRWKQGLRELLAEQHINIGIVWGESEIGRLERNPKKLYRAAQQTTMKTLRAFGKPNIFIPLP